MNDKDVEPLVDTAWLAERLKEPNVKIVDMRGYVKKKPMGQGVEEAQYVGAKEEYDKGHVPGAVYIDWTKDVVDLDDPVPAQAAGPERFARAMEERGIGDDDHVVVYDHQGGQFATRLWWLLHYYGHRRVSVLDGGWQRWTAEGRPTTDEPTQPTPAVFTPNTQPEWRTTLDGMVRRLAEPEPHATTVDARDEDQYTGRVRRGSRGGHIPGAVNLPRELFFAENGGFRPLVDIAQRVAQAGLHAEQPVVAYCNGGVAATVALFHLHRLGFRRLSNYDGSWNEWSEHPECPAETGG